VADLSVRVQSTARGAVCCVSQVCLEFFEEVLGTYLRKAEFDVASPLTIKSPTRSFGAHRGARVNL